MNNSMASLAVVAVFRARAGENEELGRRLLSLVSATRQEEGSRFYQVCQSRDGTEWIVLENWRDRAAFDFHMKTPYVSAFMQQVPQLCEGDPDIRFIDIRSPT